MPATDPLGPGFIEALRRGPILLDAAMGTRLIARGLDLQADDPCLWVVDHPEAVLEVHRLDILAGSGALLTNTFGANRGWLGRFGRAREVGSINRRAAGLAREAAGPDRFVIGSIGPSHDRPADLIEQVEALLDAGVDALLLETQRVDRAEAAIRILRSFPVPILASLFAWPEGVGDLAARLMDAGATAIGANCQSGMAPALELARRLREVCDGPLLIKPSAGLPGTKLDPPEVFEAAWPELVRLGVRLIGGCCGTTEAHVSALKGALKRA